MSNVDWQDLAEHIHTWSKSLGFAACGITDTELGTHSDHLQQWLARGFQGDMNYMAQHGSMRSEPATLHPGTTRVISVRMDYLAADTQPDEILASSALAYVSRYALGRDYHKVLKARLKQLENNIREYLLDHNFDGFLPRPFTDSAPLLEKALAEKAGLGWIGKNTLLLNEKAGSWFFLGELLVNLPLPISETPQTNRCGSCKACMDVCPTDAIVAPYELDARLCISYLTIEHRGSIPVELRAPMGNRVFGCDDCQLVCPWNRYAKHTSEPDFSPRHQLEATELVALFHWSEEEFLTRTEGSAIRRTGYQGWLRNLAVGLGNTNSADRNHHQVHQALVDKKGTSDLVDEHINWALAIQSESSD